MPLAPPPVLETARLRVRALRDDDLRDLLAVNGDPEVTRYLPYAPWAGPADAQAWLARMRGLEAQGGTVQLVIECRDDARVIGTCLLLRHDEALAQVELGYVLGRDWWGGGWMREALSPVLDWALGEAQRLARIAANVSPPNMASRKLLAHLDFRQLPPAPGDVTSETVPFELRAADWLARREKRAKPARA